MFSSIKAKAHQGKKVMHRQHAREVQERFCNIKKKTVTVLVDYPDYIDAYNKGIPGDIYCSNLVECYSQHEKCRYSGISPLYPDPFILN